ncbi:MAG: glycosyltransferase family 2 protein [Bacteroidota bacterium]|nr:glycosyltransferase family 2 protein [Bacteroidota bacterium]
MTHSVIIATMNRPAEVGRLLRCLCRQTRPPDEIVVADASSDDETERTARSLMSESGVRLILLRLTAGLCAQRNAGIDAARGDILTFFDDDVIPDARYCEWVVSRFAEDEHDRLVGIGGCPSDPQVPGPLQTAFRRFFLLQSDRGRNRFLSSGIPDFGARFEEPVEVEFLSTAAASFRRTAVGDRRFDEKTYSGAPLGLATGRAFAEDVAFSAMLAKSGILVVDPTLSYVHDRSVKNRESTFVTQCLYVYGLRSISRIHARSKIARCWALLGQGLLCTFQAFFTGEPGYLTGYMHAMRSPRSIR